MSLQALIDKRQQKIIPKELKSTTSNQSGLNSLIQRRSGNTSPQFAREKTLKENLVTGTLKTLDVLNTGAYAVGGILSGVGAIEGVKQRINPSDVFKIKNPVIALAVDIALDPTTYLTFGAGGAGKALIKGTTTKVGGKVAGRQLSREGAAKLAALVEKSLPKNAGKLTQDALSELVEKSRIQLAKEIQNGATHFLEKKGVGVGIPFSSKETKLFNFPKIPGLSKASDFLGRSKPVRALDEVFNGEKARIRQTTTDLAERENLFQIVEKGRLNLSRTTDEVTSFLTDVVKKSGDEAFDAARKIVEPIATTSSFDTILQATKIIDGKVKAGKMALKEAEKIKNIIKEVIPALKKNENALKEIGLLKQATKKTFFPRAKDFGDAVRKPVTLASSPSPIKQSALKSRKVKIGVADGTRATVKRFGKKEANVISETTKKVTKGEKLKLFTKKDVAKKQARALKSPDKKIKVIKTRIAKEKKAILDKLKGKAGVKLTPKEFADKARRQGFKKRKMPLNKVTQTRTTPAEAIVQRNIEKLKKGEKFEPIVVSPTGKIVDGNHRFEALKRAGAKEIDVLQQPEVARKVVTPVERLEGQVAKLEAQKAQRLKDIAKKFGEGDVFVSEKGLKFKLEDATVAEIEATTGIRFEKALPSVAKSLIKTGNLIRTHKLVKGLVDNVGKIDGLGIKKMGKSVDSGFVSLEKATGLPVGKGYQIPVSVRDLLKPYYKFATDESVIDNSFKYFDAVQGWWKKQALLGVAYHSRNAVSNQFNMWLGGLRNPLRVIKAIGNFMTSIGALPGKLSKADQALINAAKKHGALQGDFFAAEIGEGIVESVKRASFNPFSGKSFLVRGSQAMGSGIENAQKFALFTDRVAKGDTYAQAARHVRKFLFDYTDLSQFEQKVFKRIVPFYSWTRKNMPLQIEQLIKRPGKAASIQKLEGHIQPDDADEIKKDLPDWLKDGHPVVLPFKDKKGNPFVINLEGILPVYDLNNIANLNFKQILDMTTPLLKVPAELSTNVDSFRGFQKINKAAQTNSSILLDLIDPPIVGGQPRNDFWGGMFNDAQTHVIKTASRPLRDLDNLFQVGKTGKEKHELWQRILGTVLVKAQPVDLLKQRSWNQYIEGKEKEDLLKLYKSTKKDFINNENRLDEINAKKLEKTLVELGVTEEELIEANTQAVREDLKFTQLTQIIDSAIKEGRDINREEKARIIRELSKTYKGKSYKRALNAVNDIIERRLELAK